MTAGSSCAWVLAGGELLLTTAISVEEITRGLRESEQAAGDLLFAGLPVLPIRRREAERAGTWRRQHVARGITLHQADCLIAAATVEAGARLATANAKDFPMPELVVEEWPVGA